MWIRIWAVSRGDLDAIAAIQRIAVKKITERQYLTQEPVISTPESATLPRGEEREASETEIQREKEHQQNLGQYRQSFFQAVEQEFPLSEGSRRQLRNLQQSLQLTDEEISQIEQPIFDQKEAEQLRQQQEAENKLKVTEFVSDSHSTVEDKIPPLQLFKFKFEVVTVNIQRKWWGLGSEITLNRSHSEAQYFTEDLGNGVTLDMVYIPAGSFLMGTEDEEIGRLCKTYDEEWFRAERPQHKVNVPIFFMGHYPITQEQWRVVAGWEEQAEKELDPDPSIFKEDYEGIDRWQRPVENISWEDAKEFCARLSNKTKREYRLPTEAEWEYACRAETNTPFHFGETIITDLANYRGTDWELSGKVYPGNYGRGLKGIYRGQTTPVGYFKFANAFGLYDMHGNVWEWCEDDWHHNYQDAPNDGSAWLSEASSNKVLRGGSWDSDPDGCRSASRYDYSRDSRVDYIGFRVVRVAPRTT